MKSRRIVWALLLAMVATLVTQSSGRAQDPSQEDVRGSFMTSRPKTTDKPAKTTGAAPVHRSHRRPVTTSKTSTSGSSETSGSASQTGADKSKKTMPAQKIGLGLTLFMRDANGLAVRVDPSHEFHRGDRVRVLLETNTDGYLYIFNTTDRGQPVMIYPNAQMDEAGNYIQSHVPFEIPASTATEERLRWFTFDEHGGMERLYFVFTREPLTGVPIEDDLIKFCGSAADRCAWHPSADLWAGIEKDSNPPVVAKAQNYGGAQTGAEHTAATRGIGLARDDPEPSLVMMNASSMTSRIIAALDLIHK